MKSKTFLGEHLYSIIRLYSDFLSLMDFAHDEKISEEEFLRATGHYRYDHGILRGLIKFY